jgi:hypothetical protein
MGIGFGEIFFFNVCFNFYDGFILMEELWALLIHKFKGVVEMDF